MSRRVVWALGIIPLVLAVVIWGCGDDKKETSTNPEPEPSESDYEASASVTTTSEATITTESGAGIQVPLYAVPPTEGGQNGTMVFSIERDQTVAAVPDSSETVASDVYRFGPDGFTFGQMVNVTVPVTGNTEDKEVGLFRINQTTGEAEPYGGTFDSESGTITTQTYHLSPWYAATWSATSTAWGAFKVTNTSATHWLHICVESYDLAYPDVDTEFDGNSNCSFAPSGTIGWASSGNWYLPQGTYDLCVQMTPRGTVSTPPGDPTHGYVSGKTISHPWTRTSPLTTDLTFGSTPGDPEAGPCNCTPEPSTSVGTGEVQVTLTWHSEQEIDLDLWVIEPGDVKCYYGNTPTTTGGTLDRDNQCGSYINGRPENIYWASAPAGQYKVQVDLFSDCYNGISSMAFDVRVVVGSSVRTYAGTVTSSNSTVDVTTFTVTSSGPTAAGYGSAGPGVVFGDYLGTPAATDGIRPPKR